MKIKQEIIEEINIIFWIHRILDEKTTHLNKISNEISILNHQAQYFNKMHTCFKNDVINDLNEHFDKFGWNKKIEKLKDE